MASTGSSDTIAAISTSLGEAGIGIVRMSGERALDIADKIFFSKTKITPSAFKTYTIHYGWIKDQGQVIDEVILSVMRAPRSYTKEDVVEINCHGGIIALRRILELVLKEGCRLAEPGEFTKRAFLNGRIDLMQAEAVLDIVSAKTDFALKIGLEQLKGEFSKQINDLRAGLIDIASVLEANIDFPEEEIGSVDLEAIRGRLRNIILKLDVFLDDSRRAKIIREGIHVVICGKPNVGKSSLLNALLKEERSIVTPVSGTTRDTIEEIIDMQGIPVRIVDTAGIIEPRDLVERKAVQRSKKQIELADLVILVFDGSRALDKDDEILIRRLKKKKTVTIINKIDLKQKIDRAKINKLFPYLIELSAKNRRNLKALEDKIKELVYQGKVDIKEPVMISNLRHIEKLNNARMRLDCALKYLDEKLPVDLISQEIKEALSCCDEILGKSFSEDLLDKIFADFCIGK